MLLRHLQDMQDMQDILPATSEKLAVPREQREQHTTAKNLYGG